jgi:signal transduction histidine kinase
MHLQVYGAFLAMAALCVVVAGIVAHRAMRRGSWEQRIDAVAGLIVARVDAEPAPPAKQRTLERIGRDLDVELGLYDAAGEALAVMPGMRARLDRSVRAKPWRAHAVELPDGRLLAASWPRSPGGGLVPLLGILLVVLAIGAFPAARRVTRRLEALAAATDRLGGGDLSARVPVDGHDEIADLAQRFNAAAARVEALVHRERRMLASASHELRSPLARVRVAAELLADEPLEARRRVLADRVASDVESLDGLVADLLTVGRTSLAPRRAPHDVGVMVEALAAEHGLAFDGGAASADVDAPALRRAVVELIENARRYGGGADRLRVEAGPPLRIEVTDRGPGVPDAERDAIFEPFYRPAGHAEGRDGGVGLGLALVREIARAHGGDASVTSREGGGAIFTITLPPRPA